MDALAAAGGRSRRAICGTRWLEHHRASFPTQLSDSTELAAVSPKTALAAKAVGASQELGPIAVGTQLAFYVRPVLKLATCRYKGTHCYIFVEESQWDIIAAQEDVDKLGALLTRRLRPIPSADI